MADVLTRKQRSYCMSQIKGTNTQPEIKLRKELTRAGLSGYRLQYKILGKPDITYPRKKVCIFIDGCYWHKCPRCFMEPKTNKRFWMKKIEGNVQRDKNVNNILKREGWKIIRLWEHDVKKNLKKCVSRIRRVLKNG